MTAAIFAAMAGTGHGQIDLTGDGRIEAVVRDAQWTEISVLDGESGLARWSRSGPSIYGWAVTAHPDLDGDGLGDLIVTMPGGEGPGSAGQVQTLRGLDGQVLWTRTHGGAEARFGFGVGVVPDQNRDGVEDLIVAMRSDEPAGETGVLLSGLTGAVLAEQAGPVAQLLDSARRRAFRFRVSDLNGSGVIDILDAAEAAAAAGTEAPEADLDFSGAVDMTDVMAVIQDMAGVIPVSPSTWEYVRLSIMDPALYNDGYQLIPLRAGFTDAPVHRETHASIILRALPRHEPEDEVLMLQDNPTEPEILISNRPLYVDFGLGEYDLVITGKPVPGSDVEPARAVVRRELDRYPPGTITSTTVGNTVLSAVYVYRELTVNGGPAGGTYVVPGLVYLAAGTREGRGEAKWEEFIVRALHHEISSHLLFRYRMVFDEDAFRSHLPEGFVYEDDLPGADTFDIHKDINAVESLQDLADGFLTDYASRNLEQDFNAFAEVLLWRPELLDQFAPDSRVARKAAVVRDFYLSIDERFAEMLGAEAPIGEPGSE